jgi:signal transduction histidine kinase
LKADVRSAIGLKNRFVIFIATLFLIGNIILGVVQFYLFKSEQWNLIDNRIETTATLLLKSDLSKDDLDDVEFSRKLIENSIDSQPFNLFIRIYSEDFKILYQTGENLLTPNPQSTLQRWHTYHHLSGSLIRTLLLPLPKNKWDHQRYLQIGVILDNELMGINHIKNMIIVLIIFIVTVAFLLTQILVRSLLKPIQTMSEMIKDLSQSIGGQSFHITIKGISVPKNLYSQEFETLIQDLQTLSANIQYRFENTGFWTSQMAHEIRTPLTIISNQVEELGSYLPVKDHFKLKEIQTELEYLKHLVYEFMNWIEATQKISLSSELSVIQLNKFLQDLRTLYQGQKKSIIYINNSHYQEKGNSQIFCNPFFLKQLLSNLIDNAIKYSLEEPPRVVIFIESPCILIENISGSISQSILDKIGLPFNYSKENKQGFGLGLAWVKMICDNYKIIFELRQTPLNQYSLNSIPLYKTQVILDLSAILVPSE